MANADKYITLSNLNKFYKLLTEKFKATGTTFGGIKTGYKQNGKNYPIELDGAGNAYVNVPLEKYTLPPATTTTLGGIKVNFKPSGNDHPVKLDSKNNAYVTINTELTLSTSTSDKVGAVKIFNQYGQSENVSVNNFSESESPTTENSHYGLNIDSDGYAIIYNPEVIKIAHSDLLDLIENSILIPGKKYRIIDYITTVNASHEYYRNSQINLTVNNYESFDIIVEALTTNLLSSNAKACPKENAEYRHFGLCDMSKWELKYSVVNDAKRFTWADETNGKGVIYYMKDEFGNEAPYDFKSILFNNKFTFNCAQSSLALSRETAMTIDDDDDLNNPSLNYDASIPTTIFSSSYGKYFNYNCSYNIIKPYYIAYNNDGVKMNNSQYLNNIIICSTKLINNAINLNYNNSYNFFDYNCHDITLYNDCLYNTFKENCNNIVLGTGSKSNSFGVYCQKIEFEFSSVEGLDPSQSQSDYKYFIEQKTLPVTNCEFNNIDAVTFKLGTCIFPVNGSNSNAYDCKIEKFDNKYYIFWNTSFNNYKISNLLNKEIRINAKSNTMSNYGRKYRTIIEGISTNNVCQLYYTASGLGKIDD
jgi:hypothetical protein